MGNDIMTIANNLALALENDNEYIKYKELEIEVKKDKYLYDKISKLKKEEINIFTENINDIEKENVRKLYLELFINDLSREFLETEKNFLNKINKLFNTITNKIDIEI